MTAAAVRDGAVEGGDRRSFLARGAALAAVPAVAALAGSALAEPEPAYADTLPDYAPIPPSALGPTVTPFFVKYGNNTWAAVKAYQAAQVEYASAPVIRKYTGVLAAADVYTAGTTFLLLESVRLDLGFA